MLQRWNSRYFYRENERYRVSCAKQNIFYQFLSLSLSFWLIFRFIHFFSLDLVIFLFIFPSSLLFLSPSLSLVIFSVSYFLIPFLCASSSYLSFRSFSLCGNEISGKISEKEARYRCHVVRILRRKCGDEGVSWQRGKGGERNENQDRETRAQREAEPEREDRHRAQKKRRTSQEREKRT